MLFILVYLFDLYYHLYLNVIFSNCVGKRTSGWREEDESESKKDGGGGNGRKVFRQKGKSKGKKKRKCEVVLYTSIVIFSNCIDLKYYCLSLIYLYFCLSSVLVCICLLFKLAILVVQLKLISVSCQWSISKYSSKIYI